MGASEDLERDGFAVLRSVLPIDLIRRVQHIAAPLVEAQPEHDRAAVRSLGSLISVFDEPRFQELITSRALLGALESAGFCDLRFSAGFVLRKPPHSPATYWHQDWGYWGHEISYRSSAPQVGLLVYLDEVEVQNGCAKFLPGTHLRRHDVHDVIGSTELEALRSARDMSSTAFARVEGQVDVPACPGDIVLFDPRVLHGANSNESDGPRTCVSLWYYDRWSQLPESVRASAAHWNRLKEWPPAARRAMQFILPDYRGEATPEPIVRRPDQRLIERGDSE